MNIAVIGSGNVGGTLGEAWVRAGHKVIFGTRDGAKEAVASGAQTDTVAQAIHQSEVVVLAIPWTAMPDVMKQVKDWSGKTLIDCINPIKPGLELAVGLNTSGAEQVAQLASGARVAKAFNTTGFNNMKNPSYGGKPVSMLFCSDDSTAKNTCEKLIRDVGFDPVFAGPLKQARYLEPMAMLWITMSIQGGRDFAFTIVRR
jgi:8-hydroxy-5-deazaflavin:NADPH oxidoreductase